MTLDRNNLAQELKRIWHISQNENNNKYACVERRDVLPLILSAISTNPEISNNDIWNLILNSSSKCEVEEEYNETTPEKAYALAKAHSSKPGELSVDAFLKSNRTELEIEKFYFICQCLCTALNIDNSDEVTNPQYWDCAFDDELTPLQAVKQSQ